MNNVKCARKDCIFRGNDGLCSANDISFGPNGCNTYRLANSFAPYRADNVVIYDNAGIPSIMVRISCITDKELFHGADKPHSAFVIGGKVYDAIYISKYPNTLINGKAYSLPYQVPATGKTMEEMEKACFSKGEGWHMMTAMEWGLISNICSMNQKFPHGNTERGHSSNDPYEFGKKCDEDDGFLTLTGSGPEKWCHDWTPFGIADLCGNVQERVRGLRLMNGQLQMAGQNNDAALNIDLSEDSDRWKSMLTDEGKPIYMSCIDFDDDGIKFSTSLECDGEEDDYSHYSEWKDILYDFPVTDQMKSLGLYAAEPNTMVNIDTCGECLPLCGGDWSSYNHAGIFKWNIGYPRDYNFNHVGFRSAYFGNLTD